MSSTLKPQLVSDMKSSMKGGDKHRLGVVRIHLPRLADRPLGPGVGLVGNAIWRGIPLTELLDVEKSNVLIVSRDQQLVDSLMKELSARSCQAAVATSGFDAGVQTGTFDPDCLVVDFGIGQKEAARICQHWRRTDISRERGRCLAAECGRWRVCRRQGGRA